MKKKKNKRKHTPLDISFRIFGEIIGFGIGILACFFGLLQLYDYVFPSSISKNPETAILIFMIITSISLALFWVLLRYPQFRPTSNSDVEYPKTDITICTPEIPEQAKQLVAKIAEIHPNLDFKGIVACADLDHLLPYEVSKLLNKPFATVHASDEWLKRFNLDPCRHDKLSSGDDVIFLLWVASNGSIVRRVLPILKERNILVKSAFCMYEKKSNARKILNKNNIQLYSVSRVENDYGDASR